MSDPYEKSGVSATLKVEGRDKPWLVFHGSVERVKEDIVKAFGFETPDEGTTLHALVLDANSMLNGSGRLLKAFPGSTIESRGASSAFAEARNDDGNPPWDEPKQQSATEAMYDQIEAAESTDALKHLWATNRAAFDGDVELFAAWKAKGKALKEAS